MDEQVHVRRFTTTAVKGLRVVTPREISLEYSGARDNRRFYLIDDHARMVNGKRLGSLCAVLSAYDHDNRELMLTFPAGTIVRDVIKPGAEIDLHFYSQIKRGRLVAGPWSSALSEFAGRSLRLIDTGEHGAGVDRGRRGGVSIISRGSLEYLATVAGAPRLDPRRFRMLIEVTGIDVHGEDGWVGRELQIGEARVLIHGHVGRCLVTSRDPETGEIDIPTLDVLGSYRRQAKTTEPLALGIYGEVLEPGVVRVGDLVTVL